MVKLWYLALHSPIVQLYRGGQFFLVGGNRVLGEIHRPAASHFQLYHIMLYRVYLATSGSRTQREWWKALIAQVAVNPTAIRSRPLRPYKLPRLVVYSIYFNVWSAFIFYCIPFYFNILPVIFTKLMLR